MKAAPRYSQIISYYQSLIESGKLAEGDKIPTEEAIGELFGVSRITVRQALDGLAQGGYIYKIQGKGSFVSAKKAGMQLNHLVGFSDEMRSIGIVIFKKCRLILVLYAKMGSCSMLPSAVVSQQSILPMVQFCGALMQQVSRNEYSGQPLRLVIT